MLRLHQLFDHHVQHHPSCGQLVVSSCQNISCVKIFRFSSLPVTSRFRLSCLSQADSSRVDSAQAVGAALLLSLQAQAGCPRLRASGCRARVWLWTQAAAAWLGLGLRSWRAHGSCWVMEGKANDVSRLVQEPFRSSTLESSLSALIQDVHLKRPKDHCQVSELGSLTGISELEWTGATFRLLQLPNSEILKRFRNHVRNQKATASARRTAEQGGSQGHCTVCHRLIPWVRLPAAWGRERWVPALREQTT